MTSSNMIISRQWSDLNNNLLLSIFSRLSCLDLILGVPSVCSSWHSAARDPHCRRMRILDLSDWESITARVPFGVNFNLVLNRVLEFVSDCQLIVEFHFPRLGANMEDLEYVAYRLPNLLYCSFPNPNVHDKYYIHSVLSGFKSLKGIAVNQVFLLLDEVPSHLGKRNPDLSELKVTGEVFYAYKHLASLIVKNLPKLKKLEMQGMEVDTDATLMLLDSLQHLEYLDISGYNNSGITKEIIKKASRLKVFIWQSNCDSETTSSNQIIQWSDMSNDLLVSIFSRLSIVDKLVNLSTVCCSWRAAARDPGCWRILDLSDWDSIIASFPIYVAFNKLFNRVLEFVRESELIEGVYFPKFFWHEDFFLVSNRLPNLRYLSFQNAHVCEEVYVSTIANLRSLKGLILHADFYLPRHLPSFLNLHCRHLSELQVFGSKSFGRLAKTICKIHPKLRKLEMHCPISTWCILKLLGSLEHLEYLDISGYNLRNVDEKIIEKASRLNVHISYGRRIICRRAPTMG